MKHTLIAAMLLIVIAGCDTGVATREGPVGAAASVDELTPLQRAQLNDILTLLATTEDIAFKVDREVEATIDRVQSRFPGDPVLIDHDAMRQQAASGLSTAASAALLAPAGKDFVPEPTHRPVVIAPAYRYVPSQYGTIQAAVDASNPGDYILVVGGTHTENVLVATPNLTLIGLGATVVGGIHSTANRTAVSGFQLSLGFYSDITQAQIQFKDVSNCRAVGNRMSNTTMIGMSSGLMMNNTSNCVGLGNRVYGNLNFAQIAIHGAPGSANRIASGYASGNFIGFQSETSEPGSSEFVGNVAGGNSYAGIHVYSNSNGTSVRYNRSTCNTADILNIGSGTILVGNVTGCSP